MLLRRRSNHPGSSFPLSFLLVCGLLLVASVAFCPAAVEAAGCSGGGVGHEGRAGKPEVEAEAEARGDGAAVAEAGGEVVAQGNATEAKESSLADMIDRALEKEFPESKRLSSAVTALSCATGSVLRSSGTSARMAPDTPISAIASRLRARKFTRTAFLDTQLG